MFGALKILSKKIIKLDQGKMLTDILKEEGLQAQIVDLNQKQLYEQGVQADGSPTGEYSPRTIADKLAYGDARGIPGRIDHITGLDTGVTYASMKVEAKPEGIVITADDRNNFFDREDKGLGLTPDSLNEIRPEIRQVMIEKIRKAIAV